MAGAKKLHDARLGLLPPEEVSAALRHLTPAWNQPVTKPLVQILLFSVYWLSAWYDMVDRVRWSIYHLLYGVFFAVSTIWRIDLSVPSAKVGEDGEKREKVFALSKPVKLSDVKTIQRAFSGNKPGRSQRGYVLGHVTVSLHPLLQSLSIFYIDCICSRSTMYSALSWQTASPWQPKRMRKQAG